MMASNDNFRVEEAQQEDLVEIATIIAAAFEHMPPEQVITGPPTEKNVQAVARRYMKAIEEHSKQSSIPPLIKCTHQDPESGKKTIIGAAYWYIFDHERTPEQAQLPLYLLSCDWIEDSDQQRKARNFFQAVHRKRLQWMGSQPHAILMYMAIKPEWRRRGASTLCVKWGLEHCQDLGIPAYLEASEEGRPVYERLGFQVVDQLHLEWEGEQMQCPIMIWKPQ